MANSLTGNPIIVDTISATALLATGKIFECYTLAWVSGSLADTCVVQNGAGAVKFSATGTIAGNSTIITFNPPLLFNGLLVPTLGSGRVLLYVNRKNCP